MNARQEPTPFVTPRNSSFCASAEPAATLVPQPGELRAGGAQLRDEVDQSAVTG